MERKERKKKKKKKEGMKRIRSKKEKEKKKRKKKRERQRKQNTNLRFSRHPLPIFSQFLFNLFMFLHLLLSHLRRTITTSHLSFSSFSLPSQISSRSLLSFFLFFFLKRHHTPPHFVFPNLSFQIKPTKFSWLVRFPSLFFFFSFFFAIFLLFVKQTQKEKKNEPSALFPFSLLTRGG